MDSQRKILEDAGKWKTSDVSCGDNGTQTGEPIPEGLEVAHINRNGLDNSIENLRLVDRQTNVCNTGCRKDSKTGVKGVSYREGRLKPYSAHKQRNGIRKCKSFETIEEAVKWLDN